MARHFQAEIYIDTEGDQIAASSTDQAGKRGFGTEGRTYSGKPVEHVGDSYFVARNYAKPAIAAAQRKAITREVGRLLSEEYRQQRIAIGYTAEEFPPAPFGSEDFLRTIAASPGDMTAILVFADWLDEQGHAFTYLPKVWQVGDLLRELVCKVQTV